jgi:CubicO group peptidase (beta-lactamase class C family)
MHRWIALTALSVCFAADQDPGPKTVDEVKTQVAKILSETGVPAAAIALVARDRVLLADGIGMADPAVHRRATADTLFRVGSVTKGFTALAILQLQEQGKLSLDDPIRKYLPDVWYRNPWEATDPIRIVHLLEHTTGWDDLHFSEYVSNDPKPLTLAECVALHPDYRISRWRPGTRMAYNNGGPVMAAYIVEKITGRRFEDYAAEHIFHPLHMDSATYFPSPALAGLFEHDARTRAEYWHISFRPSGAVNASARDMANYLRMYLNRGSLDGAAIVQPRSIDRMERPESSLAARAGLRAGYGLANYTDTDDRGFVWHGHNGTIFGGLAQIGYLTDEGVGYAFMIDASSGEAEDRISGLLRTFLTRDSKAPTVPKPPSGAEQAARPFYGWYEPASPRSQFAYFFNRIGGLRRLTTAGGKLVVAEAGSPTRSFAYAGGLEWREEDQVLPEVTLIPQTPDGVFLQIDTELFRRIPAWEACSELILAGAWLVFGASAMGYAMWWMQRILWQKVRGLPSTYQHLSVRALPMLAWFTIFAPLAIGTHTGGSRDTIQRLGMVTPWSVSLLVLTTLHPVFTAGALVQVWRARRWKQHRLVWWHSLIVTLLCAVSALYLAYWNKVAFRTWS